MASQGISAAEAQDDALRWREEDFGHVDVPELTLLSSFAVGLLASSLVSEQTAPRVRGGVLFDEPLRDVLRLTDPDARNAAATASDVLLIGLIAWPLLDSGGVFAMRGDRELAAQLAGVSALSLAGTAFFTQLMKNVVRRERPYARSCATPQVDRLSHADCTTGNRYQSFHSGHAAMAFTGAGLVCAHHGALPIYGGQPVDPLACATAMTFATTTSLLRVLSDRHYLSDVLVGALVGVVSGFLIPTVTRYTR